MADLCRYVLVDRNNCELDPDFGSYREALKQAERKGYAVLERQYTFTDSELIWAPDGLEGIWPPHTIRIDEARNEEGL